MPFSIDLLSIKSESQKIKVGLNPPDMNYTEISERDKGIFRIDGLVEQEPITVF